MTNMSGINEMECDTLNVPILDVDCIMDIMLLPTSKLKFIIFFKEKSNSYFLGCDEIKGHPFAAKDTCRPLQANHDM